MDDPGQNKAFYQYLVFDTYLHPINQYFDLSFKKICREGNTCALDVFWNN